MTGLDDDRELDDFLAHRSTLHRRLAERDGSEPPPELDRLVLNRAREAISTPANAPIHRAPRWALPVSLAATVVLSLAVVMNFSRMQHGAYPVAASASPAANAAPAEAESQLLREEMPTQSFAPPAAPPALAKAQSSADVQMPEAVREMSDSSGAGAAGHVVASAGRSAANKGTRALHAEARTIAPAKRERAASNQALESVAVTAARPAPYAGDGPALVAMQAAPELPVTAPEIADSMPLSDEAKRADPKAWRREIEQLRAAGSDAEADRELAEFRKVFPREPVPAAARDPRPAR